MGIFGTETYKYGICDMGSEVALWAFSTGRLSESKHPTGTSDNGGILTLPQPAHHGRDKMLLFAEAQLQLVWLLHWSSCG